MTEWFRTSDGRTLAYRLEGAGPVLVCHPGGPGAGGGYLETLGCLGDRLTLVVLDPRGTGASERADTYTLEDYVSDLEALRDHLGLDRMKLLGFSHGGIVAMAYAAAYPSALDRLILVATLARTREPLPGALRRHEAEPWYGDAYAALNAEGDGAYSSDEETTELAFRLFPLFFARYGGLEAAYLERVRARISSEALRAFNEEPFDLRPQLSLIQTPTLVVAGAHDFLCGPEAAREIVDGIADSRLEVLEDAGHFAFVEQPERFANAVWGFTGVG